MIRKYVKVSLIILTLLPPIKYQKITISLKDIKVKSSRSSKEEYLVAGKQISDTIIQSQNFPLLVKKV